jgi:hypothetical protein
MNTKFKAKSGCDFIRDEDWKPMLKTVKGWQQYADRMAKQKTKLERFNWQSVLFLNQDQNYCRINFASMPEK